ncbi:hypothetical protein EVAR_37495_1 [Eumeta japonica]|uniref:Uncharacterized protein n=1 Tax=Eumeta variegata TaxID=151549 RepID=A0A4C1XDQ4_EUMVA|nr:hypothetical protein EVAR_37495_1 [Eumeta japonica]
MTLGSVKYTLFCLYREGERECKSRGRERGKAGGVVEENYRQRFEVLHRIKRFNGDGGESERSGGFIFMHSAGVVRAVSRGVTPATPPVHRNRFNSIAQ